ncbi:MAG: hypothetical protein WC505_06695 [Patescibacteria group bacterium]
MPVNNASCGSGAGQDILANVDTSITTTAQAVAHYGEQLRRRRGVQFCTTTYNAGQYNWEMPDATVAITGGGSYPMTVSYVQGADSGSSIFQDVEQAIEWLVRKL